MRCSHVSYEIQRYPNELSGLHGSSLVQEYVHCSAADVRFGCASAFTLQYHGTHEHMLGWGRGHFRLTTVTP
ncbi:hypothetical protein FOZ62_019152 [Perkinsus olseni]|uniref:Uncharacterized protein n=1 Tax=Perkinsus olseni TaxID=32597 RepID=A0A7J6SIY7_PEROL|nr:hypothetical protein FOZ62_019152 [Perkinsus olseni]